MNTTAFYGELRICRPRLGKRVSGRSGGLTRKKISPSALAVSPSGRYILVQYMYLTTPLIVPTSTYSVPERGCLGLAPLASMSSDEKGTLP